MKAAIIIPAYNHARPIAGVVRDCLALGMKVIVVDDGSTDGTGEIIRKMDGIFVVHHPQNLGKGAALLSGFRLAGAMGCDYALTIDADGQHDPADAAHLLAVAVKEKKRCLIIGRRQGMGGKTGGNVPWTSRFGRGFSNFWVWAAGGPKMRDSQSGFRLYPLPETMNLGVRARRYQFEVEVLVKAHRAGIAIREVPVGVVYQKRGERISHFRPWMDFHRNSATFSRLIFARIFRTMLP